MFHVTDWFTTMLGFAGGNIDALDVDGVDQWDTLVNGGSTCASNALSLYGPKMILVEYQSYWTRPICFGGVQIILDRSNL